MRCAHCYEPDSVLGGEGEFQELRIPEIISQAVSLFGPQDGPALAVELTDGEPTMKRPEQLGWLAEEAARYGLVMGINSNGYPVTPEFLKRLGHQENVLWAFSFRALSDPAFARFSGRPYNFIAPLEAAQLTQEYGYGLAHVGVTMDTLTERPEKVPEAFDYLFWLLEEHSLNREMVIWDSIQWTNSKGEELPTVARMAARDYDKRVTDEVNQAAMEYLLKCGVPKSRIG